jgi:hypothetical protein
MVRRYSLGQTLNIIAFAHDTSPTTVSLLLKARGVKLKRSGKDQWLAGRVFSPKRVQG